MSLRRIDLNADLGEGTGADAAILPLITTANVACGWHAGDATTAWETLQLARTQSVVCGAHPGHLDREHFGRREITRSAEQVYADVVYQIGALQGLARAVGTELRHVKPHGGLYHQACRESSYADAIIAASQLFGLAVLGLPGSELAQRSRGRCRFVAEGFADRRYRSDGNLVPRDQSGAFVEDPAEAAFQVERLIAEQGIETVCVHGDNPKAIRFIEHLREFLTRAGFHIQPIA